MATPENLRSRARALRLTDKAIAQRAGVHATTVWRFFKFGGGLLEKATAIEAAIVAEEQAQRERLEAVS